MKFSFLNIKSKLSSSMLVEAEFPPIIRSPRANSLKSISPSCNKMCHLNDSGKDFDFDLLYHGQML